MRSGEPGEAFGGLCTSKLFALNGTLKRAIDPRNFNLAAWAGQHPPFSTVFLLKPVPVLKPAITERANVFIKSLLSVMA